jgi:hypothetical protein
MCLPYRKLLLIMYIPSPYCGRSLCTYLHPDVGRPEPPPPGYGRGGIGGRGGPPPWRSLCAYLVPCGRPPYAHTLWETTQYVVSYCGRPPYVHLVGDEYLLVGDHPIHIPCGRSPYAHPLWEITYVHPLWETNHPMHIPCGRPPYAHTL